MGANGNVPHLPVYTIFVGRHEGVFTGELWAYLAHAEHFAAIVYLRLHRQTLYHGLSIC